MKKHIILFIAVLTCVCAIAQQPNFVFMTSEGGNAGNGAGTIIQYTAGDTSITQNDVLTAGNPVNSTLILAPNGKCYGITDNGASGADNIIEYNYSTNTYNVVASFDSSTGVYPNCTMLLVGDSTFYGTATNGGANSGGTLFSYTIGSPTITKLVDMPGGAYPYGGLIQSLDGDLYGMTYEDGAHNSGTIYRYNIGTQAYTPLHSMAAYDHALGTLLEVGRDTFYGIVSNDSIMKRGSVCSYAVGSGTYTALAYFPGMNTFSQGSLMKATDGLLYGVTENGGLYNSGGLYTGGMLFSYNIATTALDTLHNFGNLTDGFYPLTDPYQASDSIIYGLTNEGGTAGKGTIYQYNIYTHTYNSMVSLTINDGYFPGYGHVTQYTPPQAGPPIVTQPQNDTTCPGDSVTFTASASGQYTTQWQVSTNGGSTFSNIPNATDTAYGLTVIAADSGYKYRAVFTGTSGSDTSSVGTLSVIVINTTATVNGAVCTALQSGGRYQWVQCGEQGLLIEGAIFQTFTATFTGSYECLVSVGPCFDTTNCVTVTSLGIPQIPSYNFSLYPNPSSGSFTIQHNYTGKTIIQIINILGEEVKGFNMTGNDAQFDISNLAAGIYQVQISDGVQRLKVLKLVKE
jgi:uncharacterized repeat protein (TIGR03803 family)